MINLQRAMKDHRDAGAFNTLIPVWGFEGDTFVTKASDVGAVFSVDGVDYEGCDTVTRVRIVHRFLAALRPLGSDFRLYQYREKRRHDPFTAGPCAHPVAAAAMQRRVVDLNREALYVFDLHLVLLLHGPAARTLTTRGRESELGLLDAEHQRRLKRLERAAGGLVASLSDTIRPIRLAHREAYAFLERLVNVDATALGLPARLTHLDYSLPNSGLDVGPDHLQVGRQHLSVLTMKEVPGHTYAHIFTDLDRIPGEWIACVEAQPVDAGAMRGALRARARHFRGIGGAFDASLKAMAEQVEGALTDLEVGVDGQPPRAFWQTSVTLALHDRDPHAVDHAAAAAIKVLAVHDGKFYEERRNALNAWLAMVPGNIARNVRAAQMEVTDANLADVSLVTFTLARGEARNAHLDAPALAVFPTVAGASYFFNTHHGDVGHILTLGGIGSGKSYLNCFCLLNAMQYDPYVVVFDLGHSYRRVSQALGGSYLEFGTPQPTVKLNPFALPETDANKQFLHQFVRVLLEGKDSEPLTDRENRDLSEEINSLYAYSPSERRLSTLTLTQALRPRLAVWTEGGRFPLFDHAEDTLALQRFQVFEFEAMARYPELLEPLLFYVLHRVSTEIGHGFTICVLDEAWRFIRHPVLRDYVQDALKSWRKKNAAMWLATQTLKDFESADLLRTVVESCPTKLLLANPSGFDRALYADLLQLNDIELDLVANVREKKQFVVKTPTIAKLLELNTDQETAAICTHDTPGK